MLSDFALLSDFAAGLGDSADAALSSGFLAGALAANRAAISSAPTTSSSPMGAAGLGAAGGGAWGSGFLAGALAANRAAISSAPTTSSSPVGAAGLGVRVAALGALVSWLVRWLRTGLRYHPLRRHHRRRWELLAWVVRVAALGALVSWPVRWLRTELRYHPLRRHHRRRWELLAWVVRVGRFGFWFLGRRVGSEQCCDIVGSNDIIVADGSCWIGRCGWRRFRVRHSRILVSFY